jgi:hypothetical protein
MFRDTITAGSSKRKELIIFLFCFLGAYILNVIGIIQFQSPAKELYTQLHVVFLAALVLYVLSLCLRVLYYIVARFWLRK